jgi:protein-disulfide isomerase
MRRSGTRAHLWWAGLAGAAAWLALSLTASAQTSEAPKGAAATVGDDVISMAELEQSAAAELANLDQQRYRLLDQKLDQLIADRLLAREAKRRGMSVDALVQAEVSSKTSLATADDVNAFITQNRARLPQGDEAELRLKVADFLNRRLAGQRRDAYVASLRAQTPVQVHLQAPEPVRVKIDPTVGFARGPREAPVTIVEFSDFQCPFCKSVTATLKQLATQYGDRLRWVFRDFPIPALHPDAPLAHEAARCAAEQGKFWPYHDVLFEKASSLAAAALRGYAADVGVDAAVFGRCLDSHKYRAAVSADMEAGQKLGVTGTPTFFINGQMLVGNQPLAEFQKIIEHELARTASKR